MHISLTGQNLVYAVGSIQIDRTLLCGNTGGTANIRIVVHNTKLVSLLYLRNSAKVKLIIYNY